MPNTQKSGRFQSTPSVWRETCCGQDEGTHPAFQSTPSVWRETFFYFGFCALAIFQSTPSVWRETIMAEATEAAPAISIHSLRVEGDNRTEMR